MKSPGIVLARGRHLPDDPTPATHEWRSVRWQKLRSQDTRTGAH